MRNIVYHIFVAFFSIQPCWALVSSGESYSLESSIIANSGGEYLSSDEYLLRGASGQEISSDADSITRNSNYCNRSGFYNPPYFAFQKKLAVNFKNSKMELYLPPNSVDKEVFDLFLNDKIDESSYKPIVERANQKAIVNYGILSYPIVFSELAFMDEESICFNAFKNDGQFSYIIQDADRDGNVDGYDHPIRISSLRGYVLDKEDAMWLKSFGNNLSVENLKVSFIFRKSGIYSLMGQMEESVKDVFAYPVPFRPNGPNRGDGDGQTGTEEDGITFANIPQKGNIEIYSIDGRLVKNISIPWGLADSKIKWNVKNNNGQKLASGVYIWRVVSGKNSKMGKIVVIR